MSLFLLQGSIWGCTLCIFSRFYSFPCPFLLILLSYLRLRREHNRSSFQTHQRPVSSPSSSQRRWGERHKMCNYHMVFPLCGHAPTLLAGASCHLIYAQLQRINDPATHTFAPSQSLGGLPFDIPHSCMPGQRNVKKHYDNDYCSWECRNSAIGNGNRRRCGEPDAVYGCERVGVGWRR
jgi:hypothetical protein